MKVCLITTFPPSRGDLNEYAYHLARAVHADGRAELTVLADQIDAAETQSDFKIERVWRFDSVLNSFYLLRAVRRLAPEVVWFNMGFTTFAKQPVPAFLATLSPLLLRMFGVYTHVTLHSLFEATDLRAAGVRWPALYRAVGRLATQLLLASGDVSVLLPSYRTILLDRYGADPDSVHFRPHGSFNRPVATEPGAPSSDDQIVLAFGYWGTYKRLESLLDAMREVHRSIPNAVLVVAGTSHPSTPRYLESLQEKLRGSETRVRFVGYVPEPDLAELFRSAEVLVMPYTTAAGASGVMHQACEYGLPIVASDIPDLRELGREEGIAAAFYNAGDASALADQLVRLLRSDVLRRSQGEANRGASERLPIAHIVRDYLEHFAARISKDRAMPHPAVREVR